MRLTLGDIVNSIAGALKGLYPDVPVYANPNQQGTKVPCFFVFFMPSKMEHEMGKRSRRTIGIDIVYLTEKNIPDAYDQLTAVADQLDDALEFIPYTDGNFTTKLRTFDREWKANDGELHYQMTLKVMVSHLDETPGINSMESYEGGIKDAKGS